MTYDFGGYATKHNIRCSDGRVIMPEAFKDCDGQTVPLVWQHVHDSVDNVLGHAELECRPDGVYAYCSLNETEAAKNAGLAIQHGDICALSIYANKLQQVGSNVMHGVIREVSLVLAGANPGATIDNLAFAHSDGSIETIEDEACFYFVDGTPLLFHAEENKEEDEEDLTIGEVLDTLNDVQKRAVYTLIGLMDEERGKEETDSSDEKDESGEDDEKLAHADSEPEESGKPESELSPEEVQKIFDALDDSKKKVVQAVLQGVKDNKQVSEEVAAEFDKFTDEQKQMVYALAGSVMNGGKSEKKQSDKESQEDESSDEEELKHAAENGSPTIGEILDTMSDAQKDAVEKILDALEDGSKKVSKETAAVFDTCTDAQKNAVYALVGIALGNKGDRDDTPEEVSRNMADEAAKHSAFEGEDMKYNIFDAETEEATTLTHSDMATIFSDAPRYGTLRDSVIEHGISDIEVLFPEAQAVNNQPYMLQRRMEWVSTVLNGIHKSPFARVKSTAANLTEAQARAKGYVKGRRKIEEQIVALRRVTTPQTIYKLQKLDRDDIIDITDFDVVAWMKLEMRQMLDEEIARAILVGDGRGASDPEKILPDHVRPVWSDDEMYTIHKVIATADANDYTKIIDDIVRSRKGYKGSGNPTMFIGPDILTELRLLKDNDNRFRYDSDAKLAEALRVSKIEEVELFDDLVRTDANGKERKLVCIILNLADYTVGADKGGEVSLFDDFNLDYNKMEYLIETRISGALTMPKSAIAVEIQTTTDAQADPTYTKVASPVVGSIGSYYETDEYGRFFKTADVAIVTGKTYYTLDE